MREHQENDSKSADEYFWDAEKQVDLGVDSRSAPMYEQYEIAIAAAVADGNQTAATELKGRLTALRQVFQSEKSALN